MTTNKSQNPRIALITGASRGLGRNTAVHLADRGIDVIFTYHSNETEAHKLVKELQIKGRRVHALRLDAGDIKSFDGFKAQLSEVLKSWKTERFDYLINNAGTGLHKSFMETTEADFDSLMNIHLKGVFFLTQKLLPILADGGRILNISSGLARFSLPGYAAYASMKGGIEVLTRYLAKELGSRGITVNTVAPGAIETDFGGGAVRDNKDVNKMVASGTALGRAGLPDDIGPAIASLLSEDNRWVNAQRLEISGGFSI